MRRSLYMCANAKVFDYRIRCAKGYILDPYLNLGISIDRLARGMPLEFDICQDCKEYDELGPLVPKDERGWIR